MLKPPKYSVVLSLDKSIRQHIGFLLKATDCAPRIDSSVGYFRLQPRETQSPWFAHSVSFSEIHLVERKILKLRTGIRPWITQCNKKGGASKRRGKWDIGRERGSKAGEQEKTWNEHPSGALYPALSHSVISAVYLIFSDKDKIRAANLLLLSPPQP